ncbi:MAG: hypothetical protein DRI90_11115 [Deltaproteobacteria bacterium]|nr:MAG: hypothetical protein DRI90_11115 [Deltaproteobacteria bacterium]
MVMKGASLLVALGAVVSLASCAGGNPAADGPLTGSPSSGAVATATVDSGSPDEPTDIGNACREQVASLQDWLKAIEAAGLPLAMSLLDEGAHLVKRKGPALDEPAPVVHVTSSSVLLDGVPVDMPSGLQTELAKLINLRRSMMPLSPFIQAPRSYVAINAEVPWSQVNNVAREAAGAGIVQLTLLFVDPERSVPGPPPSAIDADLARLAKASKARRQQIAAELMAYVYQDCQEALKVIAQMGVHEVADIKQVILDELPAAIGACACAADDASVKALHWTIFGNSKPTSGVTLQLAPPDSLPVTTLSLPAELPWNDAYVQVVALATEASKQPIGFAVSAADDRAEKPAPIK